MSLRAAIGATAVFLVLALTLGRFAWVRAEPPSAAPPVSAGTSSTAAPASAAPAASAVPAASAAPSAGDEAAAKHAKRTACLKSAKDKKLVGARKNAFVKDCTAAP